MERQNIIVSKFGGSSVADAESVGKVINIINQNLNRNVVVISAPGRNSRFHTKVTDLLIENRCVEVLQRFEEMGQELGWQQIMTAIRDTREQFSSNSNHDFRLSRGEYLMARMLADLTESQFVDAFDLINIDRSRKVGIESYAQITSRLSEVNGRIIVPGFYGRSSSGKVRTLSRDGSDVTGAVIARSLDASIYEIFSDTNGLYSGDPRSEESALRYEAMDYDQAEILSKSSMALHSQVISTLRGSLVAINYRNTFSPDDSGTWIYPTKNGRFRNQ